MKFDLHYLFAAKYAKWIIIGLISLFSLLIFGEWTSLIFSTSTPSTETPVELSATTNNNKNPFDAVLHTSFFGEYVPNDLTNVKKSMLDVTLVGILFTGRLNDSQVIIRAANGEELNYKLGDSIPGDALIKKITANGVLVERNGALESLSLPKNDLTFKPEAEPLEEE